MKDLATSRIRRAYTGYCAIAFAAFLVLMSSTVGMVTNTSYGGVTKDLATELGQTPAGSTDLGGNMAYAINDQAGIFVHLTSSAGLVVSWIMLACMMMVIVSGIVQRSLTKTVLPGIVFITAAAMLGSGYLERHDGGFLLADPSATIAVMTLIGGLLCTVLSFGKPTVIPRAPDYVEHGDGGERHARSMAHGRSSG